jgi:hypothetical protein
MSADLPVAANLRFHEVADFVVTLPGALMDFAAQSALSLR